MSSMASIWLRRLTRRKLSSWVVARISLQAIAQLYRAPETMGVHLPPGTSLIRPTGFDLETAEFLPTALKRPKAPGASSRSLQNNNFSTSGTSPNQDVSDQFLAELRHLRDEVTTLRQEVKQKEATNVSELPLQNGEDWWKRDVRSDAGNFQSPALTSADPAASPHMFGASADGAGFSDAGYSGPYTAQVTGNMSLR